MQTLTDIRHLLAKHGIRPKHRLGQNFLHDQNQIRKLVTAALGEPGMGESGRSPVVLEVGPGTGALTEALLEQGCAVVACEIDRDMIAILRERLNDRITLVEDDVLAGKHEINPSVLHAVGHRPFILVSNLPYQIATPLMMNLLVGVPQCRGQFVTIQKEVSDRLLAQPGTKEYGPLSIVAQTFARLELIGVVPPSCFWPEPDVTSAMVSLLPPPLKGGGEGVGRSSLSGRDLERRAFARFVMNVFTKRRKQLGTIFGRGCALPAGIDPLWRPEALTPEQVLQLYVWMHRATSA